MKQPVKLLYEVNTRIWLKELSAAHGHAVALDNLPEDEIARLAKMGFDALWCMGVWKSSESGRDVALNHGGILHEIGLALPDFAPQDVASSPYAVADYEIDAALGTDDGIRKLKERLNMRGIRLILDFVPNHIALDHPWVKEHPDYFIKGSQRDLKENPFGYFSMDGTAVLAFGKDPYFPAWTDVAQLNYYNPKTRAAMFEALDNVASMCDGVRCDMAMLVLKNIQKAVWGSRVFAGGNFKEPASEFWQKAIGPIRKKHPGFLFIAEVYWGMEALLLSMGFDYVYDKEFYDNLRDSRLDLLKNRIKELDVASHWLKFTENHDEARSAAVFGDDRVRAAAFLMLFAPGAHMIYQGQMSGFHKKLPIQLLRRPPEEENRDISLFYEKLLPVLKNSGMWKQIEISSAGGGNSTFNSIFAWSAFPSYMAVVNYSSSPSQGYIKADVGSIRTEHMIFKDILGDKEFEAKKSDVTSRGIYVDMPPYSYNLFALLPK